MSAGFAALAPIIAEPNSLFKAPVFEPSEPPEQEHAIDEASTTSESVVDTTMEVDTWMDLDEPLMVQPVHRTWEAFESGTTAVHAPLFLSEAGAAAYDALLSWHGDPLKLNNSGVPVIETKAYFSSLLSLALGQESLMFVRNNLAKTFQPVLPQFRISGYSRDIVLGVQEECLSCGISILDLRSFIQKSYAGEASPCRVGLASAISQILQVIHKYVTVDEEQPRSLLQLQTTVACLTAILKPLVKLNSQLRQAIGDHEILSVVFYHASQADADNRYIRDMMREILQRVSMPWIQFLQEWVGTKVEQGIPLSKIDVGARKWFVKVDTEIFVDDFGRHVEDIDFRLDRTRMPSFIPDDVAQSIFETGKNLRFIKLHHPENLLANTHNIMIQKPPEVRWLFDWNDVSQVEHRIKEFGDRMAVAVNGYRREIRSRTPVVANLDTAKENHVYNPAYFGVDEREMESRILASMERLQQPLRDETIQDPLSITVRHQLDQGVLDNSEDGLTPHWSLVPLLSFGAIASAQARFINQEHMRLLFSEHGMFDHFRLYREFHLLGNGLFCTRLSQSLFNPDLESTEREAGVARQGGVMGLRLGGRDTWPPASSELRLALMGILSDAYFDQHPKSAQRLVKGWDKLPGDLSFAVRDLSPEEIEKCMNPNSLEALDFLCLQYTTPPALSSVITPVILLQYDRIFRFLLRVLRMIYVVNELFRQTLWTNRIYGYELADEEYRFVREARGFISSVAGYILDTAISIPWRAFESRLREIQSALAVSGGSPKKQPPSPLQLQQLHSQFLHAVMSGMFLRKKQKSILNLLEDIFNSVLAYAMSVRARHSSAVSRGESEEMQPNIMYEEFKQKVQVFITVCRSLSEKAKSESRDRDNEWLFTTAGLGDESIVAQLLSKLDLDNYYVK
ncbi:hypothetical protein NQ176_g3629 [Zarea fungicola]|uniref:Uncharacterized protein n=1 Tax=Zarea fungicola TaxID=93591 RepID=A0ACC1NK24_9HYPO|nr:hypothetical protein NQ176_g3629 [Lecanicillium fungicola]